MRTIRFAHISDTHIGPDPGAVRYNARPAACLTRVLNEIARQQVPVDFLLHTGDVAADPDPACYRLTADLLRDCPLPCYFVAGNHDDPTMLAAHLLMGPHNNLTAGAPWLTYTFESGGHRFLVLGAEAPPEIEPHGRLGPDVLDAVDQHLRQPGSWTVIVHFPPLPLDCAWIDREMLLTDGEALHQQLLPYRERLRGVLFGHVHRTVSLIRDGILYASAGSTFSRFNVGPADEKMVFEPCAPPAWSLVTITGEQMLIRSHLLTPEPLTVPGEPRRSS